MAKTPTLPTLPDDDDDNVDENGIPLDEPDEFQVPDGDSEGDDASFRAQLAGVNFDDARHEALRREMLYPAGDYEKDEPWTFSRAKNVKVWDEDKQPGDFNPKGRTVISFFGYPKTRYDKEHNDYKPWLNFRVSMDVRAHRDPEKAEKQKDIATRLWVEAEDAFINTYERKPASQLEVIDFLTQESYTMNTMNGDSGLIVLHIKVPRKKR